MSHTLSKHLFFSQESKCHVLMALADDVEALLCEHKLCRISVRGNAVDFHDGYSISKGVQLSSQENRV